MIFDARGEIPTLEGSYYCCIIGSGPAGISLASKLADAGRRVLLLEAGDREVTQESQELYEGVVLGQDYFPLSAPRLRALGGTSGHWGGQCMLLDRSDFLPRGDVPLSGWPIRYDDLEPYQAGASRILQTGSFGSSNRKPVDDKGTLEIVDQRFSSDRSFYDVENDDPVRFGIKYRAFLENSQQIDLVLNANLVGFNTDSASGQITEAHVRNYQDKEGSFSADYYVLAMGALENSRMLLLLNAEQNNRFGNQYDMVGRCFMEHIGVRNGAYFITKRLYSHSPAWEFERLFRRAVPELLLSPSYEKLLDNGWMNTVVRLGRLEQKPVDERKIGSSSFMNSLQFNEDYFFSGTSWVVGEQQPNLTSRVFLGKERDRFGLNIVGLDMRLTDKDIASLRGSTIEVAKFLIRTGLGRMQMDPTLWNSPSLEGVPIDYFSHHMGGTRMSQSPETGVVDSNCKVHGSKNLFVAGAGVFTTGGFANPTFTIVQLAIRLADHLIGKPVGVN